MSATGTEVELATTSDMATASASGSAPVPVADAPAPPPRRPRVLLMGSVLAGTAASAVIAAMVAVYTQVRYDYLADGGQGYARPNGVWLGDPEISIPLTPTNVGLASLVMSVITAAAAGYCLRRGDRPNAYVSLATTLLLGAAFITETVFIWQEMGAGLTESAQATMILAITGTHLAMIGGGMLFLLVMGFRALGGQLTGRAAEGYNSAVVFWVISVAMYALVWYAIYITK